MDPVVSAVKRLNQFLKQHEIRFMLIGGLANAVWGRVRATTDADIVLILGGRNIPEMVRLLGTRFKLLKPDPVDFAKRTYVIPIQVTKTVRADLSVAILPYEQQAIDLAVVKDIGGVRAPVCRPEDLIIYKAISERVKDWLDIEGVLARQGAELDQDYIDHWLEQFAQALERPALVTRYQALREQVLGQKKRKRKDWRRRET